MRTIHAILLVTLVALSAAQVTTSAPFSTGPYVNMDSSSGLTTTTTGGDMNPATIPSAGPGNTAQIESGTVGGYVTASVQVEVLTNSTTLFNGFQFCAPHGMVVDAGAQVTITTPQFSVTNQDFIVNGPSVKNDSAVAVTFDSAPDTLGSVHVEKNLKIQGNANVLFTTHTQVNVGGNLQFDATTSAVFRVLPVGTNDDQVLVCAMGIDFAGANITIIGDLGANLVVVRTNNVISQPGSVKLVTTVSGDDISMLSLTCDNKNGCMLTNMAAPTTTMGSAASSVQASLAVVIAAVMAAFALLA